MYCRNGEQTPPAYRTDRLYQVDGRWYFVTREKTREGPYPSMQDASVGIDRYIAHMRSDAQPAR
jgi:hypothetical protein